MNQPISAYARLGLVHHMLYPDCSEHPAQHAETLAALAGRADIETLDCCLPYDTDARAGLIPILRDCGKTDITFAIHFFPLRQLGLCTPGLAMQAQIRLLMEDLIEQAAAIGATGFIFASGAPAPGQATDRHYATFREFCGWLCDALAHHDITALLEPFDTTIDKKFLYGSTASCVELIASLEPGITNFGLELDVAHLPLMGESFAAAIRTAAPYLQRVHLGNCVVRDTRHPRYGDTHPPMGFPGGEIDVPELTDILRTLLEIGFLNRENRGSLVLEMTPWPGRSVEATIADSFERLASAWESV